MKNLLIISAIAASTFSQQSGCSKSGCVTERDVQRHDRKQFRASVVLKEGGTIAQANEYRRTTLVSVRRTMRGYKHLFVTDESDTVYLYLHPKLETGECYLIKNLLFS